MVSCIFARTTSISRVRMGTKLKVACPWDWLRLPGRVDVPVSVKQLVDEAIRSPQSVVVNQSLRVEKTIFMKGLDGHTTTHRVSEDAMICKILGERMNEMDVMISLNGKMVGMHDTMKDIGIGHDCTLHYTRRLRGGAQRFRQQQPDIPGQWTCSACGQERVWPVRNRCFRCGCPKCKTCTHVSYQQISILTLNFNTSFIGHLTNVAALEYFTLTVFFSVFVERCSRVWLGCIERYTWLAVFDENTRFSGHGMSFSWIPRKLSCPWYRCCLVDSGGNLLKTWLLASLYLCLFSTLPCLSQCFWNDTEKISMSLRKC